MLEQKDEVGLSALQMQLAHYLVHGLSHYPFQGEGTGIGKAVIVLVNIVHLNSKQWILTWKLSWSNRFSLIYTSPIFCR